MRRGEVLKREQRTAILELHRNGLGTRAIARAIKVSRGRVKEVIASGAVEPPAIVRPELAAPYRQEIVELHQQYKGNLVLVHEQLLSLGAQLSYPALTAFCRRHGIGAPAKVAVGSYDHAPGQEMQHDTSPHRVSLGGKLVRVQTASAVLCYSRMLYVQCYPTFQRFDCKIFLTDALSYFGGVPGVVLIDNTHVVVAAGSGAAAVMAPEMAGFAERYGFVFRAHEIGDVNRSAKVERPFSFIEGNFLAGRSFADFAALNAQARAWCERVNGTRKRHLHAAPRELLVTELPHLRPLPLWVPEVVRVHHRIVDVDAAVCLATNRYSVPEEWIGRRVEVRESTQRLEIDLGRGTPVVHTRLVGVSHQRVTLPEHRRPRGSHRRRAETPPEEAAILTAAPELAGFLAGLSTHGRKSRTRAARHLLRMLREYPRAPLVAALGEAAAYGLFDLDRIERMVLRRIQKEYFTLEGESHD
jgi:transposase